MSLFRRRRPDPVPPTNVRLVLRDGRVIPVDCRYRGLRDGLHDWEVITNVGAGEVHQMLVDVFPAHTSIAFPLEAP